ncbi:hypothetical protein VTH82DRAFT_7308 [Thermothelomyces myriococcoides]
MLLDLIGIFMGLAVICRDHAWQRGPSAADLTEELANHDLFVDGMALVAAALANHSKTTCPSLWSLSHLTELKGKFRLEYAISVHSTEYIRRNACLLPL